MSIADLLKHLIEENKKLLLENEQLKREVEELKKAVTGCDHNSKS